MKNDTRINVIVNIIRTLVLTLLSFITFPWVCRYLGDSAVGAYTWANTFVAYFLILAKIGIPNLAVRECVKVRDDKEKLSNEKLLLIGSGQEKEKYEKFIKDNNIQNVFLMDFLKKKELFEVLKACDYFITLSEEDIFGHTTLEAMANGLPVISSNRVVSSLDIIRNGENGYLVDIENEQEIVKAIENINHKMDQSAIETANNNTIEKSAKKLHELLENLKQ